MNSPAQRIALALLAGLLLGAPSPAADETVRALLVSAGWRAEAIPVEALARPDAAAGAQGVWLWSKAVAPTRLPADRRPPAALEPTPGRLGVQVGAGRGRLPGGLRLLAAPVAMWLEVPEALIPSWPVPESGRLDIPRPPAEPWRLRLVGHEIGSGWSEVTPGQRHAVLEPVPASDRRVTLAADSGEPAAGTLVRVFSAGGREGENLIAAYRCDAEGAITLPALPGEVEVELLVVDEGFSPLSFAGRLSSLPARLRLSPGAALRGRLVDGEGDAVAAAAVSVLSFSAPGSPRVVARSGLSDAAGRWRIVGLAPGEVQFAVAAEGYARLQRTVDLAAGERDLGTLALGRARRVELRVTDPEGLAIGGAETWTAAGHRGVAGTDGVVRLDGLPGDRAVTAVVQARGFLDRSVLLDPSVPGTPTVVLTPAVRVTGRLLEPGGEPVAGGATALEIGAGSAAGEIRADGSFAVEMAPETRGVLVLTSERTAEMRLTLEPAAAGTLRNLGDLVAPVGLTLTGTVVDGDEAGPIAGARVWALRSVEDPLLAWARGDVLETRSGADGGFALRGLRPTAVVLRIDAPARARRYLDLDLAADTPAHDLGNVALDRGSEVTVRFDEPPPPGLQARLDLRGEWLESDMLTVSVAGDAAVFAHVPPGRATLSLVRGHEAVCDREIEVPAGEALEVTCDPGGTVVRGMVLAGERPTGPGSLAWSAGGSRRPGVILKRRVGGLETAEVLWGGRPDVRVAVDAGGWFETEMLRAGRWQVVWAPESGAPAGRPLEVVLEDAEEQEVVLRLPTPAIHGTVVDSGDRLGVAGARVRELSQGAFALTDADGAFTLGGLEPGPLRVQAQLGDASSEVLALELDAERAPPAVELELVERRGGVTVEVRGADGRPSAGAFVFLEPAGAPLRLLSADLDGRVETVLHPPYPQRLRAAAYAAGAWAFGDWLDLATAREGVLLAVGGVGAVEISCERSCGLAAIRSPGGWDLGSLNLHLGRRLTLSPERALLLGGLPPGRYLVGAGGTETGFTVDEGRSREVRLP